MSQLDMFGAGPARCEFHGPGNVCDRCPERFCTDGSGFVHPSDARGRVPLRACRGCGKLRPREAWNVHDWHRCLDCAPLTEAQRAVEKRATPPLPRRQ